MLETLKEFIVFLRQRKKLVLLPIVFLLIVLGGIIVFGQSSAVGSLMYTIF